MHQKGRRIDFIDARYGERHYTAFGAWKNRCQLFERNWDLFLASREVQLNMPYARLPEERDYVVRLSILVVSLKGISGSSDQIDFLRS